MSPVTVAGLFVVLLAATAMQAATISNDTTSGKTVISPELRAQLNQIYYELEVAAQVADVYASDVEDEEQWQDADEQANTQVLVDSLRVLENAMQAGADSVVEYGANLTLATGSD